MNGTEHDAAVFGFFKAFPSPFHVNLDSTLVQQTVSLQVTILRPDPRAQIHTRCGISCLRLSRQEVGRANPTRTPA